MKKNLIIATLLALGTASVFAQQGGGFTAPSSPANTTGGFTGTKTPQIQTISQVQQMRDDTKVTLQGNIIQHLGKDKYVFKDSTGQITIEIDDEDWGGVTVGPDDLVQIYGEVDKDWNSIEIDVDSIRKVN